MSNRQIAPFDAFRHEIASRADELASILPPHIPVERFQATAMIAIKENPALLFADRRSLHQAITEAAEDGLHPDGREAVITIYKERRKRRNENGVIVEEWVEVANYNPMLFGIRKRAREVCGIIIDADVVYEKDHFRRRGGDCPSLEHEPPMLGQDRGKPVGAYAIFRQGSEVLHREVMDAKQIEDVHQQSRQKDGLMWTRFWTEAWKKSVIRRGIKTVPSVPEFERLVKRDDRDFPQFNRAQPAQQIQSSPVPSLQQEQSAPAPRLTAEPPHDEDGVIPEIAEPEPSEAPQQANQSPATKPKSKVDDAMEAYVAACNAAETSAALNGIWQTFEKKIPVSRHEEAVGIFERAYQRILQNGGA